MKKSYKARDVLGKAAGALVTQKRYKRVYVEISNVCNLQCHFCPEVEREKHFMSPEFFKKIIGEIAPITESVCFHLMGEPLAHPHFDEYVKVCKGARLPVNITTNGTLLNQARVESLLSPIIRQVNFSIQSFEANFPDQNISSYLNKIFSFTDRAFKERPDLFINYRLWNLNDPQSQTAANLLILQKIKDRFQTEFKEQTDVRRQKSILVKGRLYLHFDSRFEWPHPSRPFRSDEGFCHGLSSHFGILADGTLVPCCLDKEGNISLGNCHGANIQEILSGKRALDMALGFQHGKLIEEMCQKCTFITRFDKKARKLRNTGVNPANVVVGV